MGDVVDRFGKPVDIDGLAKSPPPPPPSGMSDERLPRLEGLVDGLRVTKPMTLTVVSAFLGALAIVLSVLTFVLLGIGGRIDRIEARMDRLETKLDALPARIDAIGDKNHAALVGLATAIASGITAARTPAPAPEAPPTKP